MKSISASVGQGGVNRWADVKTVQELINANLGRLTPLRPFVVDGKSGPMTVGAIREFQSRVVKLNPTDGRVDPRGRTLSALNKGASGPPAPGGGPTPLPYPSVGTPVSVT